MASFSRLVQRCSSKCWKQHIACKQLRMLETTYCSAFGAHTLLGNRQGCGTNITGVHTLLGNWQGCSSTSKGPRAVSPRAGGLSKGISLSLGSNPKITVSSRTNDSSNTVRPPEVSCQLRYPLALRVDGAVTHNLLPTSFSILRPFKNLKTNCIKNTISNVIMTPGYYPGLLDENG